MKHIISNIFILLIVLSMPTFGEIRTELINPKTSGRVWVYLPTNVDKTNMPVVLVPPAGTKLFHGINLSEGDSQEHIPYVNAGFAVISFDLSGAWPVNESDENIYLSINDFVSSNGGIDDMVQALEIAKKHYSQIQFKNIYIAGHSSAATISLMAAQKLSNISGVIAYAPVIDTESYLSEITEAVGSDLPNFRKVLVETSPHKNIEKYTMPIFLFSAKDDDHLTTRLQNYNTFVASLSKKSSTFTYVQVKQGGHYQSMIDEGIPRAIAWLKGIQKKVE